MKITWLGHSCFILESHGFRLVTDPFESVRGFANTNTEADAVYCSHDHFDHAYTKGVQLRSGKVSPFAVRKIAGCHDDQNGTLRGPNTIHCFTAEGLTAVHLGDQGCPLTKEQAEAIGACDLLLLPIGGTFTLDPAGAKAAADLLNPRVILPMHYREGGKGFEELCTADDFAALYPAESVHRYTESSFELLADTPSQVAILTMP